MTDHETYMHAIAVFGADMQELVAIEECAELIQAITHKQRGRAHNIAEEIADVEIMLEQLKIINACEKEVEEIHKNKVERLYNRIFDECL
jgi:NTP pyrophosphatase (non-canonical NTP hydrolase)